MAQKAIAREAGFGLTATSSPVVRRRGYPTCPERRPSILAQRSPTALGQYRRSPLRAGGIPAPSYDRTRRGRQSKPGLSRDRLLRHRGPASGCHRNDLESRAGMTAASLLILFVAR